MLNPDYKDMSSALIDCGVEFLVVGAYALAAHGLPRATGDIDFWIARSPENSNRVIAALTRFGAPISDWTAADFQQPELVFQIGVEPRRIDIITSIGHLNFDEAWKRRITVRVDGIELPVISRDDLIQSKQEAGRPQDLADVARLKKQHFKPDR